MSVRYTGSSRESLSIAKVLLFWQSGRTFFSEMPAKGEGQLIATQLL